LHIILIATHRVALDARSDVIMQTVDPVPVRLRCPVEVWIVTAREAGAQAMLARPPGIRHVAY
jgi:hypothetical protein